MQFKVLRSQVLLLIPLSIAFLNLKKNLGFLFGQKIVNLGSEKLNYQIIILLDNLRTLYRNGTDIQIGNVLAFLKLQKILGIFSFSEQIFYRKHFMVLLLFPRWLVKLRNRTFNGTRSAKTDDRVRISKHFFKPHRLSEIIVTINFIFVKTKIITILFCPLPSLV